MLDHDIITAPATAAGGALMIIRISGEGAIECADRIFSARTPLTSAATATAHYGNIVDGARIVDDVVATVFRAPHSYTGEDAVEISCHGSRYITAEILRLLGSAGARMAKAGEFSARAFLAGRIDLSQAEAVADIIAADSRSALAIASTQMRGGYSDSLRAIRTELLDAASLLELELDFSEEDVEFADRTRLHNMLDDAHTHITTLAASFHTGNAIKEGIRTAIIGSPNVGKSTLLNRLTGEERAMVSDVAGTTRDTIEETVTINDVVFRFIDTAGLHATDDRLEQMGIERTVKSLQKAQIVLLMSDAADTAACDFALPQLSSDQILIRVINKIDIHATTATCATAADDTVYISAKTGEGIEALRRALIATVDLDSVYRGDSIVSNARHFAALQSADAAIADAITALRTALPTEIVSLHLRTATAALGEITGEITSDTILANIFSKFCIGK